MRLYLSLRKGKTTIFFISPIKLTNNSKIKLNKAKIIWTVYNVTDEDKILLGTTEYNLATGYYSFDHLKEFLESKNCNVTLEKSGKVTITPDAGKSLNLKSIGPLLGFNVNDTFSSKTTSPYIADVNTGLRTISVFCNRVNTFRNFEMGRRSEKIVNILVPAGNLWGITTEHSLETETHLENGEVSTFEFSVKDDSIKSNKDSYTLYLDCSIE